RFGGIDPTLPLPCERDMGRWLTIDRACPRSASDTHFNTLSPSERDALGISQASSEVLTLNDSVVRGITLPIPARRDRLTPLPFHRRAKARRYCMSRGYAT